MTCRGVARQGEDGRPHLCQTGQTSQTGQTQASRRAQTAYPRCYQVAKYYPAVILRAAYPCDNFGHSNSAWQRRFAVPRRAAQLVRIGTDVYGERGRCMRCITPAVTLRAAIPSDKSLPKPNHTAAGKPSGDIVTHPPSSSGCSRTITVTVR